MTMDYTEEELASVTRMINAEKDMLYNIGCSRCGKHINDSDFVDIDATVLAIKRHAERGRYIRSRLGFIAEDVPISDSTRDLVDSDKSRLSYILGCEAVLDRLVHTCKGKRYARL